jgi:hypothetical protein
MRLKGRYIKAYSEPTTISKTISIQPYAKASVPSIKPSKIIAKREPLRNSEAPYYQS